MSRWEHSAWRGSCACGTGQFVIACESENYPPFRIRYGAWSQCDKCRKEYLIIQADGPGCVHLTKRSDCDAARAASAARNKAWDTDPEVIAACARLRRMLDQQKSQAARYRKLQEYQLYSYSLTNFRNEYRSDPDATIRSIVFINRARFQALDEACARFNGWEIPHAPTYRMEFAGTAC
jgi:hypothetical protein